MIASGVYVRCGVASQADLHLRKEWRCAWAAKNITVECKCICQVLEVELCCCFGTQGEHVHMNTCTMC